MEWEKREKRERDVVVEREDEEEKVEAEKKVRLNKWHMCGIVVIFVFLSVLNV